MKHQQWNIPSLPVAQCRSLMEDGIPALLAAVLSARGVRTPEQARAFLQGEKAPLHIPFLLRDMDRAAARLGRAVERGEPIAVYGDYDADGVTSTCLLTDFLYRLGAQVISYIPDRIQEGYGLNDRAVETLAARGVTLIVTVDCGITGARQVELARRLGMDVVITDHHECPDTLPAACAVVDPCRQDCPYPFSGLAGVGVALKLALALAGPEGQEQVLRDYGELAAIGTVADVMELTGENRTIVHLGLESLARTRRPGLRALLEQAGAGGKPVTAATIGFTLAPRLNAAGRMGRADLALQLLLTDDLEQAQTLAGQLCQLNRQRQELEGEIFQDCVAQLDSRSGPPPALVLAGEGWHQGVVGIVASRLAERYGCPAFVISLEGEMGKGSCRSFGGFNLFAALEQCAGLLEQFGGHELAAGFSIRREHIPAFRAHMERAVLAYTGGRPLVGTLSVDLQLPDASLLTLEQVETLSLLEPCGQGNPKPLLALAGVTVAARQSVGGGRHLKLRLRCQGTVLDGIYFSPGEQADLLRPGSRVDVAFVPEVNEFRGARTVQLQLRDVHPAPSKAQAQRELVGRVRQGGPFSQAEASSLTPTRREFELVWRYLRGRAARGPLEDRPDRLSPALAGEGPPERAFGRTMVCIQVFQERGLISVEHSGSDRLHICMEPVQGKVDLEQSELLCLLRRLTGA
ncbi:MAG: single-stranded-DNA-specific exonuclease RecJ [Oscillospiraceae bacterium]|nr:single-stranded-DNA-specific exonuclease RecJ [Oscillospiraceae bacterium]